jgi:hypothetical protein
VVGRPLRRAIRAGAAALWLVAVGILLNIVVGLFGFSRWRQPVIAVSAIVVVSSAVTAAATAYRRLRPTPATWNPSSRQWSNPDTSPAARGGRLHCPTCRRPQRPSGPRPSPRAPSRNRTIDGALTFEARGHQWLGEVAALEESLRHIRDKRSQLQRQTPAHDPTYDEMGATATAIPAL